MTSRPPELSPLREASRDAARDLPVPSAERRIPRADREAVPPGPSFVRGLWRIAAADASSGNRVRLLRDGSETFSAKLALIDRAKYTVELEGYIFRADEVGEQFAEALCRAAERGAIVRVLVDWVGRMGTPGRFFAGMRERGVDVRIFNPPGFRRWLGLVPRDHRKLLVVDHEAGVTGGVGIGREWKTGVLKRKRSPWRDTGVLIEGPAAYDMSHAFARMWLRSFGAERRRTVRHVTRKARGSDIDARAHAPALVGIVEGEPGRFRIARAIQLQAVSAERSIWIASAYFAPSYAEIEALAGAARDGVDVRVLVPSRYDHPWIRRLTRRFYRRLLTNGVRLFEWQGEMMHAKTSVVDGRWVRVGSTDFNPLGIAINFELDAMVEDEELGRAAEAMFVRDLERSVEITL